MIRQRTAWIIAIFGFSVTGSCQRHPPKPSVPTAHSELLNYHKPLSQLRDLSRPGTKAVAFRIEKARYRLTVLVNGRPVKSYPVVFGRNPVDDKRQEGDGCTPEGTFRIRARYPHRRWSRFLWLDYPTPDSWRKFRAAQRKGEISARAAIGGEIGIHGVPAGQDSLIDTPTNWTLGCIALKNKDIEEIYALARGGTLVTIVTGK